MNEVQKQAFKELEELKINHAETGRDREACYPSIEEEEKMGLLESVIDGCLEAKKEYVLNQVHPICRRCCKLDLTCIGLDANAEDKQMIGCYLSGPIKE